MFRLAACNGPRAFRVTQATSRSIGSRHHSAAAASISEYMSGYRAA